MNDVNSSFKLRMENVVNWIKFNQLLVNWSKTKIMFLTKKRQYPKTVNFAGNDVEVVYSFKLLGVIIDSKLNVHDQIKNLKSLVNRKLYGIKHMFYLSKNVKFHFFKSFIMPHFDYCSSLF